jgi:radical SAM protein with 4Fe4S-binding SPASM domain
LKIKLEMVAFHITPICENKCEYCYMGDTGTDKHPLYQKIENVMNELANQGVKIILLGGGNPCTYPRLEDVIKIGHKLGFHIDIISNTLEFRNFRNKSTLRYINGFDTTLLGPDGASHDEVAKREGAYNNLVSNIRKLINDGHTIGIVVNATPSTYDKLFLTARCLIEKEKVPLYGIRYIMIQRVIPKGRASTTLEYGLKKDHIDTLFTDIEKIDKTYGLKIVFEDAFPLCIVKEKYHRYLSPCVWGYTKGAINWDGNVSRCGADPRFSLGNIFEKPLKETWEKSPVLLSFRSTDWMPQECKKCQLLEKCRCGCPLSRITESDHEPDILCPYSSL